MRLAIWNFSLSAGKWTSADDEFSDVSGSDTYSRFTQSRRSQLLQPHSSTPIGKFITTSISLVIKSYTLGEAQVVLLRTRNRAIIPSLLANFLNYSRFPDDVFLTQVCLKKYIYQSSHWIGSDLALKRRRLKSGCSIQFCNFNYNTAIFGARYCFLLNNYYCETAYLY